MSAASMACAAPAPSSSTARRCAPASCSRCRPRAAAWSPSKGLSNDRDLTPLQKSFRRHHALQCGFCTPGMITTAHALLSEEPECDAARVREVLSGNLCRCTGYISIVEAVLDARAAYKRARRTAHEDRQLVHRQPDRAPRGPALPARPRAVCRRSRRAQACCTRRSCAVRWRTAASARSMFRAARALAGVHSVITAKDIGNRVPRVPMRLQPLPDFEPFGQPVIAETKVRYVGEAIALVLADSPGIAEDALGLIEVDIEPLPPVADRHASARNEVPAVRAAGHKPGDQVPRRARRRRGGVQGRALHPARELPHPAAHGAAHGAARPAGRMGCRARAAHRLRCRQGAVFQPPHAGEADGPCGRRRSRSSRTTSAAALARAASSIRRTF